jgi:hypothetical protein
MPIGVSHSTAIGKDIRDPIRLGKIEVAHDLSLKIFQIAYSFSFNHIQQI